MKNNTSNITTTKAPIFGLFSLVTAFTLVFTFVSPVAHAGLTPTLTLSNLGNGSVSITVAGDADASITLYYSSPTAGSALQSVGVIGATAANGYFSTTLTGTSYNLYSIPYNAPVYVVVDGLRSPVVAWPYYENIVGGATVNSQLYFSVNSVNLNVGQNQSVQINQGVGVYPYTNTNYANNTNGYVNNPGTYYISANTNPSSVSANVSGNSLYVNAISYGTANITVCQSNAVYPVYNTYNNGNQCATLTVTVNYNGYNYPTYGNTYPYSGGYQYGNTPYNYGYVNTSTYVPATVYNTPSYSSYSYGYSGYSYPTVSYPQYYPYY